MNWIAHLETNEFPEFHESEVGRVEHEGASGWSAWVYIPSRLRTGNVEKHKVGECYTSAESAKVAVVRAYRKYSPISAATHNSPR
jgi:hypothetical protein